jgi:hypothetical protein
VKAFLICVLALATGLPALAQPSPSTYPMEEIARPLTLPSGMLQFSGDYVSTNVSQSWAGGTSAYAESALRLGLRAGVSDVLELDAGLALGKEAVGPQTIFDSPGVPISVGAKVLALDTPTLDAAPGLELTHFFPIPQETPHGPTTGPSWTSLTLAANLRWRAGQTLWVYGGRELISLGLSPTSSTVFALDGGVGLQLWPMLSATIGSRFAALQVSGPGASTSWIRGAIPLNATVRLGLGRRIDLVASAEVGDLKDASALYTLVAGAVIRL